MWAQILQILLGLAMAAGVALALPGGVVTVLAAALAVSLLLATPKMLYLVLTSGLFVGLVAVSAWEAKLMVAATGLVVVLVSRALRRNVGVLGLLACGLALMPSYVYYAVGAALAAGLAVLLWRILTRQPWRGPNMLESRKWRVWVLPGRDARKGQGGEDDG